MKDILPVIYYNIDEQTSLDREPYKFLTKKLCNIKYALGEKETDINICGNENSVLQVCYSLLNQLIAILSFKD